MSNEGVNSTVGTLQMYSNLINMGFPDELALMAAQKFPKNAYAAVNWISSQSATTPTSKPSKRKPPKSNPPASPNPIIYQANQQQSSTDNKQDLKSWVIQNKLNMKTLQILNDNDVTKINDLKVLQNDNDIVEFANDLGLKIIQRKKFIAAVRHLLSSQPQQQQQQQQIQPGQQQYAYSHNNLNNYNNVSNIAIPSGSASAKRLGSLSKGVNQLSSMYSGLKTQFSVNNKNIQPQVDDIKQKDIIKQNKKRHNPVPGCHQVKYGKNKSFLDPTRRNRAMLVIGATGTGKTTCLNSMMNYLFDVKFDDKYRYKLIMDNADADQSKSQTQKVTAYYLNPSSLDYSLTLVDTPGYADTVGISQDDQITKKIKYFFDKKIQSIDAVCFVIRAPQARLEATQKYVFQRVLEVFGNDIKDNIFILLTFADGQRPPALAAIKKERIPYRKCFKLNNSGFFLEQNNPVDDADDLDDGDMGSMFWDMGMKSFHKFFIELDKVTSQSLTLTRKVLSRREKLQNYICAIQPTIQKAYSILEVMRKQIYEINKNAAIIDNSKDYTYQVMVSKTRRVDVEPGTFTTTCTNCPDQYTCHNSCAYEDNQDKKDCCAMDSDGNCTVCPNNCDWLAHKNLPYIVEFYEVEQTKTTKELRDRYVNAQSAQSESDQIIAGLMGDLVSQERKLDQIIDNIRKCINELRKIALQPNIMSKDQYIDQLIEAEKRKRKPGWQSRIATLEKLKENQKILLDINNNNFDAQFDNYKDVNQYLNTKNHRQNYIQQSRLNSKNKSKNKSKKKKGFGDWFSNLF